MEEEVNISALTHEGKGFGKTADGMAVFVPRAVPHDRVLVSITKKKSYAFGKIIKILEPSPLRLEKVDCPHFDDCGGCDFRHISYESEFSLKLDIAAAQLARANMSPIFAGHIPATSTDRYRNKAFFHAASDDDGFFFGLSQKEDNTIIRINDCLLLPSIFMDIKKECETLLSDKMSDFSTIAGLYIRQAKTSGEIMLCLVQKDKSQHLPQDFTGQLLAKFEKIKQILININPRPKKQNLGRENIILHGENINESLLGLSLSLSPLSFFQVNHDMTEKLYQKAQEILSPQKSDILLDLYCGIGSIGLSMAKNTGFVLGAEIIPSAVADARQNAKNNDIQNARFFHTDVQNLANILKEDENLPNLLILDPPRKGVSAKTLAEIARLAPEKILMISCNFTTAVADIAILEKQDYKYVSSLIVDIFPRTAHFESINLLIKK